MLDGSLTWPTVLCLKLFLAANGIKMSHEGKSVDPLAFLTNGIEYISAPLTGWDRHTKAALTEFLVRKPVARTPPLLDAACAAQNNEGEDAGRVTTMRMGVEWDAQSTRALQSFLNKNGSDLLVSGNMGLFSAGTCGTR